MALPTKLTLEIVTPDRSLVREDADEVQVPGAEGYRGILPGHTPLLATLGVGELWYRNGQEKHYFAISGGFVEVLPDRVTVLADAAEVAQDKARTHRGS
jgi:F-type H+-transporting ATPase subunit epsilon